MCRMRPPSRFTPPACIKPINHQDAGKPFGASPHQFLRVAFLHQANYRPCNGMDFAKRHFFRVTAIDHAEISVKKPKTAGVAQLVEHPICNRAVGSSSLSASTILPIASCVNTLICRHIICLQVMRCKVMADIFSRYGNYISVGVQVFMFLYASQFILNEYFPNLSSALHTVFSFCLVLVPLYVSIYSQTKYAQSFMKDY